MWKAFCQSPTARLPATMAIADPNAAMMALYQPTYFACSFSSENMSARMASAAVAVTPHPTETYRMRVNRK